MTVSRHMALPEGKEWIDTGCYVAPSCLNCPLVACVHDVPYYVQKQEVKRTGIQALRKEGLVVSEIIRLTGYSRRTVFRALEGVRA